MTDYLTFAFNDRFLDCCEVLEWIRQFVVDRLLPLLIQWMYDVIWPVILIKQWHDGLHN